MVLPGRTTVQKRTPGKARAASGTRIPRKQLSLERIPDAGGDAVSIDSEPKTETTATGEVVEGLPGSKSVARAEGSPRNRGGPQSPLPALTARAKQERRRNDKKRRLALRGVGLVHDLSGAGRKPGRWRKGPTRRRSPHRQPAL